MYLVSRRKFVKGLAAGGAVAAFGEWPQAAARPLGAVALAEAAGQPRAQETLRGTAFDLVIGETRMNFTGSPKVALTINGSVPGPLLRWREGDTVTLRVRNTLDEDTSIHWHGIILPANMDGVPGLSFHGIRPTRDLHLHVHGETGRAPTGTTATPVSRSNGASTVRSSSIRAGPDPIASDREHVILLSDWTDESPERVFGRLKKQSDYYNFNQAHARRLLQGCARAGPEADARRSPGVGRDAHEPHGPRRRRRRDLHHLMNGVTPNGNWTGLFTPGERVRLRFINGSAMTYFDVRIPGLKMTVVAADGLRVHPVTVDEFRIATAETFDVIVEPSGQDAFTIFAQAMDRTALCRRHAGRPRRAEGARAVARSAAAADDGGHGARHVRACRTRHAAAAASANPRTATRSSTCRR